MHWKFSRNHQKHPGTFQDQHIGASELPSLPAAEPPSACRQAPRRDSRRANNSSVDVSPRVPEHRTEGIILRILFGENLVAYIS